MWETTRDERVRDSYKPKWEVQVNITNGNLDSSASPEGNNKHWDRGFILWNSGDIKANNNIAYKRWIDTLQKFQEQLSQVATVTGIENINVNSQVTPLTNEEIGQLERLALQRFGNNGNRLIKLVEMFNVQPQKLNNSERQTLENIIWDKRAADIQVSFEGKGFNKQLDVSNWNYAVWALYLLIIMGGWYHTFKKAQPNNKNNTPTTTNS